jgi:PAS domain-containing protein
LENLESKFTNNLENFPELIWIMEYPVFEFSFLGRSFETIWNQPCEKYIGSINLFLGTVHPDDCQRINYGLRFRAANGDYNENYRIILPDGSFRLIQDCAMPIRNEAGKIEMIAGIAKDITNTNIE